MSPTTGDIEASVTTQFSSEGGEVLHSSENCWHYSRYRQMIKITTLR